VSANALRAVESELVFGNKDLCYRYKFCRVNKSTMQGRGCSSVLFSLCIICVIYLMVVSLLCISHIFSFVYTSQYVTRS
jgi:hypothetical protein